MTLPYPRLTGSGLVHSHECDHNIPVFITIPQYYHVQMLLYNIMYRVVQDMWHQHQRIVQ